MHSTRKTAALALAGAAALSFGAAATATAATPAGGTYANCGYGAACIYAGANWNGTPLAYYSYGAHKLSNEYGVHRVFNNQYGGTTVRLCTGSNGTGCGSPITEYTYDDVNLTPINSILLTAG
jgi:hypothetical protein